ncbi:unnamed protein product, partial [marine sediment metagenome]
MNCERFSVGREHRSSLPIYGSPQLNQRVSDCWSGRPWAAPLAVLLAGWLYLAASPTAVAQETADYFRQNCISCHTIGGGRLTGPDLKNVTDRKDGAWLVRFILDPDAMINSGDSYALNLVKEAGGVKMTKPVGITKDRAEALIKLIEAESAKERSEFAGLQISMEPFTKDDRKLGRAYFTGKKPLENGATACFSCHTVRGVGALGGGRVGPDLSLVYERLEGRRALSQWLSAPATTTMQPLFRERQLTAAEIHALAALFEHSAEQGGEEDMSGPLA